jgi:hypothetical protein
VSRRYRAATLCREVKTLAQQPNRRIRAQADPDLLVRGAGTDQSSRNRMDWSRDELQAENGIRGSLRNGEWWSATWAVWSSGSGSGLIGAWDCRGRERSAGREVGRVPAAKASTRPGKRARRERGEAVNERPLRCSDRSQEAPRTNRKLTAAMPTWRSVLEGLDGSEAWAGMARYHFSS